MVCEPERARAVFDLVQTALWEHARIEVNLGKTKVWNAAGEEPPGVRELGRANDPCWVGDRYLPTDRQGLLVLGTPLGHEAYVQFQLRQKQQDHALLLERIPLVPDLQAAWLLLLFCANTRANYLLRVMPPSQVEGFAASHDLGLQQCLARLLGTERPAEFTGRQWCRAQQPLRLGGLGLRSAVSLRQAAYWASWADTLPMIQERHPVLAQRLLQ